MGRTGRFNLVRVSVLRMLMFATGVLTLPLLAGASPALVSQDVPVPGGLRALAHALEIDVPDRARCVAEVVRLVYASSRAHRDHNDSRLRRLVTHLRAARAVRMPLGVTTDSISLDEVPMPLSASVWSQAVFRRPVGPNELFAEVMSDPSAALLAYGLAALDDQTLQYFADHPEILTWLYEKDAPVFGSFAAHLRIHDNRVVPPGGDRAVALWEAVLNAQATQPAAFVRELFGRNAGRLAYLYDIIGHLDSPRAAFALGLWIEDAGSRVDRFRVLASVASSAFPEWNAGKYPFSRPSHDLMSMFSRVRAAPTGAPGSPASQSFWTRAFEASNRHSDVAGAPERLDSGPLVDAGWLAEALVSTRIRTRIDRLDQFAFGQRAFATANAAALPDALVSVAAFPRTAMLMLTLERIGIARPAGYAAFARQAHRLSGLNVVRGRAALAQFQGAIAMIDRLVRVRTIDSSQAEGLLATLAAVPIDADRGYRGALAPWLQQQLGTALGGAHDVDGVLIAALAGASNSFPPSPVSWEGQRYVFDLVTHDAERLRRIRAGLIDSSIEAALNLHRVAEKLLVDATAPAALQAALAVLQTLTSAPSTQVTASTALRLAQSADARSGQAPEVAGLLLELTDVLLAESLLSLAYAAEWGPRRGAARLRDVVDGHDFGFGLAVREKRTHVAWSLPRLTSPAGKPWHIEGSALGLDIALAPLALRRINADALASAPVLLSTERETFVTSLALMNAFTLQDDVRDAIADAVGRGQRRVEALDAASTDVNAVIREVAMDGWRARALRWTIAREPQRAGSLLSLTDLLYLGGGGHLDLNPWGMSALDVTGCLCLQMASPGRSNGFVGRPQLGWLATTVPDLNLRVALTLRELGLPAALAKSVLTAAVQEFVDRVNPSHADDWLTLVRTAQGLSRDRIEDYVAAATFGGPLVIGSMSH